MRVTVNFECGGCFKKVEGTKSIEERFESFNGKGYGFGVWKRDTIEDVAPEGWVPFDPYTHTCYCPDCWAEIMSDEEIA